MRIRISLSLIALLTPFTVSLHADDSLNDECQSRKRVGIDNFLQIVGVLDPLIINAKECKERNLNKARKEQHADYISSYSNDKSFRENYPLPNGVTRSDQYEISGQLATNDSTRGLNDDSLKPKLSVVPGFSNISVRRK